MLLAIDVGNTHTVVGVYNGSVLEHTWRILTNRVHTADELRLKVVTLLHAGGYKDAQGWKSALASVVPQLTRAWTDALSTMTGENPIICSIDTAGDLFDPDYPSPREIGSDRIADAVAARALYGAPVIILDFGTATNMEVIDKNGRFIGGIIAPGVETSAASLFSHATRLAATELVEPPAAIGKNTAEAIQSGVLLGETDRADGLVNRIFKQLGYTAPVIATGGFSSVIGPISTTITEVNPDLTLEGLRLIAERVAGK